MVEVENKNYQKIKDFLRYLSSKNFSHHTLRAYERDIKDFFDFLSKGNFKDGNLEEGILKKEILEEGILKEEIEKYIIFLMKNRKSSATIERKISVIKSFLKFLKGKTAIELKWKKEKKFPLHLEEDDIDKMLEISGIREKVIVELLYLGLRVSELEHLDFEDIDFLRGEIRVLGKGKKMRIVPLSYGAREVLQEYQKKTGRNSGPILLNKMGDRLSSRSIRKIVNSLGEKIGKRCWPHLIRHSIATHLLKSGADIRVIQELLGHSSINTTQKYTHLDIDWIKMLYQKTHPINKMEKKENRSDEKIKK